MRIADHRRRRLPRLEPDRALSAAGPRDPGHRQFRDRQARGRAGRAGPDGGRRRRSPIDGAGRRAFDAFRPTHVIHSAAAYKDPDDWREDVAHQRVGTINVVEAAQARRREALRQFPDRARATAGPTRCRSRSTTRRARSPATAFPRSPASSIVALSGLPFVSLRLANVTGPRLAIGPIPTFYKRLKAGQKCFCTDARARFPRHVRLLRRRWTSCCATMRRAASSTSRPATAHSIKDVFDAVVAYLGVTLTEPVPVVPPAADDVPAVVLDPSRTPSRARLAGEDRLRRDDRRACCNGTMPTASATIYSHLAAPAVVAR